MTFRTAYEPGVLRAVGRNGGKEAATWEMRTAGKAVKVTAAADRAGIVAGFDEVSVVTRAGGGCEGGAESAAGDLVTFKIEGPGVIVAVDNGDKVSHEAYQGMQRQLFAGGRSRLCGRRGRGGSR